MILYVSVRSILPQHFFKRVIQNYFVVSGILIFYLSDGCRTNSELASLPEVFPVDVPIHQSFRGITFQIPTTSPKIIQHFDPAR